MNSSLNSSLEKENSFNGKTKSQVKVKNGKQVPQWGGFLQVLLTEGEWDTGGGGVILPGDFSTSGDGTFLLFACISSLLLFQAVGKKVGGKVEEERTGPLYTALPNGKEQRIKDEKALKVPDSFLPSVSVVSPRVTHLAVLTGPKVELHESPGRVRGAAEDSDEHLCD